MSMLRALRGRVVDRLRRRRERRRQRARIELELERALIERVDALVRAETQPLIDRGRAMLDIDEPHDVWTLRPTAHGAVEFSICVQQADEVTFHPRLPGTEQWCTLGFWDRDHEALVARVRDYLRALVAGAITLHANESGGVAVVITTDDGVEHRHVYNTWRGPPPGGADGWERYDAAPYETSSASR